MAKKTKLLSSIQNSLGKLQTSLDSLKGSQKSPAQLDVAITRISTRFAKVIEQIDKDAAKEQTLKKEGKKKPLNTYMQFSEAYRPKIRAELEKIRDKVGVTDVARELGKLWKQDLGKKWRAEHPSTKKDT